MADWLQAGVALAIPLFGGILWLGRLHSTVNSLSRRIRDLETTDDKRVELLQDIVTRLVRIETKLER